ncbi:BREX-2 system phosphatase PglZ [Streptomyces europaeiscabiei]|uniref:BREX-2 system phosphatase PglZ n=1 Tax=Streptomyces europaeiscabiei TaxID=146819 RepID=UPI0029BAB426|nr:BREX-2 system phosphatase PglZ [Streptomyces europaeiscabiei]MDX2763511.1 BREX-2 system phosphatase PglZ [Streptomyces europaeiscabiei]
MSTATTSTVAVRLNLATITQYLSAQSSLSDALTGRDQRRAVLLRSSPQWDGPAAHAWGDGLSARIAVAPSPLAVHELLLGHLSGTATGPAVLVVLTDREQNELDPAILARAYKRRIDTVDSWDVVRDAFGAHQVDQRLRDDKWAAEALLDAAPPRGGWPRLGGGILSRGTALSALALRRLRLGSYEDEAARQDHTTSADRLDTHALLGWSLLPGRPEGFLALRGPERGGLAQFLGEDDRAGLAGRALLALVEAEHGPDAVAFGLVCAALWCHAEPDATVYTARGRAERWFGERPPARGEQLDAIATAFGRASEDYVGTLLAAAARDGAASSEGAREARRTSDTVLERASSLVRQFGAEAAARTSPLLPAGLDARFSAVGTALAAGEPGPLDTAVRSLSEHRRVQGLEVQSRIERTRMAQRLVQWLATGPAVEASHVGAAIKRHVDETAWVDRALEHIEAGGDPDDRLRAAYDALAERVRERRHEIDRDFAGVLATWTAAGTDPGGMLTVETFLERVVKPVVRGTDRRVLLIVLDGMSAAIATELGEELRASWAEFDPVAAEGKPPRRRAMAAALPTLTSVSRTSLFAGRLTQGSQNDEAQLFPVLPLWGGAPAAVFHKDDLRADSAGDTFGPALTEALMDGRTHVAVVLNAIDDRLAKEQKLGDGAWQAGHIPGLPDLLRIAASQGLAVIITSDHGHVVDRHGVKVDTGSPLSARHRTPDGVVGPAEIALHGTRVVAPQPGGSIVALWDADSRYTARKAGYHGGASLAEFTIPVLAFLPFGAPPPPAWRELGEQRPTWWLLEEPAPRPATVSPAVAAPAKRPTRQKPTKVQAQLARTHDSLFDFAVVPASDDEETLVTATLVGPDDTLVSGLFASEAFQGQIGLLARKPPMDKVEGAIRALLDSGGTLPVTALAQRVSYPTTRADGFAAILRQLLNYDGVQVLETLPDGRTVRLDLSLLRMQFDLA